MKENAKCCQVDAFSISHFVSLQIVCVLDGLAAVSGTASITAQGVNLLVDHFRRLVVCVDGLGKRHMKRILMFFHLLTSCHSLPLQRWVIRGMMLKNQEVCYV